MVDIAVFATIYLMPALLHQALDNLRRKMIECQASLTPELLGHIHSQVDKRSLLHYFTQAALATIGRSWPVDKATDQTLESWKRVFERHPTFGSDLFYVQVKGWTLSDLARGAGCRFHRHLSQQASPISNPNQISCSRLRNECFEDVGYVCNAATASEKWEQNRRKISVENEVPVDDPTPVQDSEYLMGSLEDDLDRFTLNGTAAREEMDTSA
jgi:hypothetical protein